MHNNLKRFISQLIRYSTINDIEYLYLHSSSISVNQYFPKFTYVS